MKFMMVLNDRETFTDLDGCAIIGVDDDFDDSYIPENAVEISSFHTYTEGGVAGWMMMQRTESSVSIESHTIQNIDE